MQDLLNSLKPVAAPVGSVMDAVREQGEKKEKPITLEIPFATREDMLFARNVLKEYGSGDVTQGLLILCGGEL